MTGAVVSDSTVPLAVPIATVVVGDRDRDRVVVVGRVEVRTRNRARAGRSRDTVPADVVLSPQSIVAVCVSFVPGSVNGTEIATVSPAGAVGCCTIAPGTGFWLPTVNVVLSLYGRVDAVADGDRRVDDRVVVADEGQGRARACPRRSALHTAPGPPVVVKVHE